MLPNKASQMLLRLVLAELFELLLQNVKLHAKQRQQTAVHQVGRYRDKHAGECSVGRYDVKHFIHDRDFAIISKGEPQEHRELTVVNPISEVVAVDRNANRREIEERKQKDEKPNVSPILIF